jgi:dihydrofolate synthase/folylpolyglutamate synthase
LVTAEPLAWLFALEQFGIKFGLDNIVALLAAIDNPHHAFRSVHVAGTNGKGSVTAMVDAAFLAAGHRSARYTSPHMVDLAERFVIDGHPVEHEALARVVGDLRVAVERLMKAGTLQAPPTFFEVTTAAAFELFRRAGVTIAVCEVGLGGRLDATNVLRPMVTAITSIAFDHEQYLGRTIGEIAFEKAGIIKPGIPVVVGRMDAEAVAMIDTVARARQAPVVAAWDGVETARESHNAIRLLTPHRNYGRVDLALAGDHQIDNAVVAVRLLEIVDASGVAVPERAIVEGLAKVRWPGRLELRVLADGREALLDAAHNPQGAAALAAFLLTGNTQKLPLVFAAMRDKDTTAMFEALAPAIGTLIVTRASNPRSSDPSELAAHARIVAPALAILVQPSVREALAAAWRISPRIVVGGSIFLLGDVIKELAGS